MVVMENLYLSKEKKWSIENIFREENRDMIRSNKRRPNLICFFAFFF